MINHREDNKNGRVEVYWHDPTASEWVCLKWVLSPNFSQDLGIIMIMGIPKFTYDSYIYIHILIFLIYTYVHIHIYMIYVYVPFISSCCRRSCFDFHPSGARSAAPRLQSFLLNQDYPQLRMPNSSRFAFFLPSWSSMGWFDV